jgi:hypothetical protein
MPQGLEPAEFVQVLLGDEQAGGGYIHLTGYVSPEAAEGRTRVYLDPHLGAWVEIAEGDIRHSVPADHPNGLVRLWVRRAAEVTYGTAPAVVERHLIDLIDILERRPPKSKTNVCAYGWDDPLW